MSTIFSRPEGDSLGLRADKGQDPVIAWRCRNGREDPVQHLGYNCRRGSSADAPRGRFVDKVGRGHLSDVSRPADPLAQVRVRPYWLARGV
jgi:hypothetical protein